MTLFYCLTSQDLAHRQKLMRDHLHLQHGEQPQILSADLGRGSSAGLPEMPEEA
jgi:hypothetical protein